MPELPDVERARRLLDARCVGRKITWVQAADDHIVFGGRSSGDIERHLRGRAVVGSGRRGKQFWLALAGGRALLLHFGMTGEIHVRGEATSHYRKIEAAVGDEWPPRYTKLELRFGEDLAVAYTDPRRLGRIHAIDGDAADSPQVAKLGFDPVLDPPTPADFAQAVTRRRTPIKALLLNQAFSAGVGNWIADEVLFQSGIHPEHVAAALSRDQTDTLLAQLKHVCTLAVDVNAESERFPRDWLFHYRWAKGKRATPLLPDGRQIAFVTVGGRTSAYVPNVQALPGAAAAETGDAEVDDAKPGDAGASDADAPPRRKRRRR
ncbi:hypothetical protein IWQ56_002213 [Coemansia nantahalensis]|uniref:Uncharacterized protein n=1 Tax=Coemansia nantahalensis TaxID=2789366 RepID=A0ACC1K0I3_9FUNG|nr:hypothetical protein IWQ56_002213 [Coemansia nantahalensis]KAJ2770902.1 hypothetical protein IWQ57_002448 [Coemansia nantahalensis]